MVQVKNNIDFHELREFLHQKSDDMKNKVREIVLAYKPLKK